MSERTYWRAKTLLKSGMVKIIGHSLKAINFTVGKYDIIYYKDKKLFSCTCVHNSLWKGDKKETCYHIKACKELMKIVNMP